MSNATSPTSGTSRLLADDYNTLISKPVGVPISVTNRGPDTSIFARLVGPGGRIDMNSQVSLGLNVAEPFTIPAGGFIHVFDPKDEDSFGALIDVN